MPEPSPYDVLGVSPEASASEIRSAFRDKVRASHPDTTAGAGDDRDVVEVVEAYRRLTARGEDGVAGVAGRAQPTVVRHVEVRRARPAPPDHADSPIPLSCPECRGAGWAQALVACPDCRGSGAITRLEAHGARIVACRRCRGRGEGHARKRCSTCEGSGIVSGSGR